MRRAFSLIEVLLAILMIVMLAGTIVPVAAMIGRSSASTDVRLERAAALARVYDEIAAAVARPDAVIAGGSRSFEVTTPDDRLSVAVEEGSLRLTSPRGVLAVAGVTRLGVASFVEGQASEGVAPDADVIELAVWFGEADEAAPALPGSVFRVALRGSASGAAGDRSSEAREPLARRSGAFRSDSSSEGAGR